MNTKQLFMIPLLLLLVTVGFAQKGKPTYFITKGDDTTFCKTLTYDTDLQGALSKIEYTDLQGTKVALKGKKNVPDVITFCIKGNITDKIPLKADKPDSYTRFTDRVVDGKLKVYLAQQGRVAMSGGGSGPSGTYRFFLKMPNGKYYKINTSNIKTYIKPYLMKCKEFKSKYTGNFSAKEEEFMKMIKLYNSLCDE